MKNMNTTLEIPEGSKATIQGKVIAFNRTIVELKREYISPNWTPNVTFNRTIVELKQSSKDLHNEYVNSFNRTIVELKHWNTLLR